jgi:hypothetical protein
MNEHEIHHEDHHVYRLAKNRFIVMIIGTILLALFLVSIALALYASSGAAQVDLSRPGYSAIRDQAKEDDQDAKSFSSSGPIDKASLEEFEELYNDAAKSATTVKAFDSNVLSDAALHIVETGSDNQ